MSTFRVTKISRGWSPETIEKSLSTVFMLFLHGLLLLALCVICAAILSSRLVYAQEIDGGAVEAPATPSASVMLDEPVKKKVVSYPYKQTMVVSAYYSPLPDQEYYVTGSYEGDIRLNGGGVRGADGTPVYPGMIAAPPSYPFGFKMRIPGVGTVAVHDRGGAIKGNRLDVWMGHGDTGLKRALNWGKRAVEIELLGIAPDVKESVYLEDYYEAEKFIRKVIIKNKMFPEDIWFESKGEEVTKLQKALIKLGYLSGEPTGFYGEETMTAVFNFQKDNNIVTDRGQLGAGHFGIQTRTRMEKIMNNNDPEAYIPPNPRVVFISQDLSPGDKGEEVRLLQAELKKLNFLRIDPTGYFGPVTEHALFKFQQKKGIVKSKDEPGAGTLGPKTREYFSQILTAQSQVKRLVAIKKGKKSEEKDNGKLLAVASQDAKKAECKSAGKFAVDLDPGMKGAQVKTLQEILSGLGYFKSGTATGYFGPQTVQALVTFQKDKKIIDSKDDLGAGRLGPVTRAHLNKLLAEA